MSTVETKEDCAQPRPKNTATTCFSAVLGLVAAAPTCTTVGIISLLGLAGGTATALSIASWLTPLLVGLTVVLLGRAHYVMYVLKRRNRFSLVTTWTATVFVTSFWTWQWAIM
jgi:hypothetical protein